jgi:looped-hinge helix DNA binding domain, AbrB family
MTVELKVKVSKKGQVVIPAEIREKYGIEPNTTLSLKEDNGELKIILPKKLKNIIGMGKEIKEDLTREVKVMRKEWDEALKNESGS